MFAQVHALYKTRLLYYARRFQLEWEEAEDLVAESFLALWRSRDELQSETHVRNFLFLTLRNKTLNLLSAKKRHQTLLQQYDPGQTTIDPALSADIVETEMLYLLKEAIETLPTECKRIFELSYHEEHTPAEIARLLDMNPATVRSQKRRAIQLLREWMKKNLPFFCTLFTLICNYW